MVGDLCAGRESIHAVAGFLYDRKIVGLSFANQGTGPAESCFQGGIKAIRLHGLCLACRLTGFGCQGFPLRTCSRRRQGSQMALQSGKKFFCLEGRGAEGDIGGFLAFAKIGAALGHDELICAQGFDLRGQILVAGIGCAHRRNQGFYMRRGFGLV